MSDKPAETPNKEGAKALSEALYWLVRLTVVGVIAYFGWYEPIMLGALVSTFAPVYFLVSWIGFQAFVWTATILYVAFVTSGEVRRRRARRLLIQARPFAPRPPGSTISAMAELRPSLRRVLFWLVLVAGFALRMVVGLVAITLILVFAVSVPLGIGSAVDFLMSPGAESSFSLAWLVIAAAFAVFMPRRARRPLLDHPWLSGYMVWRRIRTTLDRLNTALSAP